MKRSSLIHCCVLAMIMMLATSLAFAQDVTNFDDIDKVAIDISSGTATITGPTTITLNNVSAMGGTYWVDLQWNAAQNVFVVVDYGVSSQDTCGAFVAPGVWKEFDCYNLAAVGKTTSANPLIPSWELIGGYWQWGRKGPSSSQWYDTNAEHFAHGPTGPEYGEANSDSISEWSQSDAPNGAWSDTSKTANDPCPEGFRVPTIAQWDGVIDNNTQSTVGTWSSSYYDHTNYGVARFFGNDLMLPAAGNRNNGSGALSYRGYGGYYWSSSEYSSYYARGLGFYSGSAGTCGSYSRRYGRSVRCIAE